MGGKKVPKIDMPTNLGTLSYIAGLVDGDGCITITKSFNRKNSINCSHSLTVLIVNTSEKLILWLLENIGGRVYTVNKNGDLKFRQKTAYQWYLGGSNAEIFLASIEPLLIIKRDQAKLALKFRRLEFDRKCRARSLNQPLVAKREELKQALHKLNMRGPVQ